MDQNYRSPFLVPKPRITFGACSPIFLTWTSDIEHSSTISMYILVAILIVLLIIFYRSPAKSFIPQDVDKPNGLRHFAFCCHVPPGLGWKSHHAPWKLCAVECSLHWGLNVFSLFTDVKDCVALQSTMWDFDDRLVGLDCCLIVSLALICTTTSHIWCTVLHCYTIYSFHFESLSLISIMDFPNSGLNSTDRAPIIFGKWKCKQLMTG
jgi:hypothetical protein